MPWSVIRFHRRKSAPARRACACSAILLAAVLGTLAPLPARAWTTELGYSVNMVNGTVFEVVARPGSGGPDFWCAAADFTRQVLGTGGVRRIYLVRGHGPADTEPGKSGVQFSLTPPPGADAPPGLTLSITRIGENLMAASAQTYCMDKKNLEF